MIDRILQSFNLSEKPSDIHLLIRLLSGILNDNAIFPVRLIADQNAQPIKEWVLNVSKKSEIVLSNTIAILVLMKHSLSHHELISILVERNHEYA